MKTKALLSATTELEVQFFDVDSMRVVWHGNYVKYLEVARCELLKLFDYSYLQMDREYFSQYFIEVVLFNKNLNRRDFASTLFTWKCCSLYSVHSSSLRAVTDTLRP